MPQRVTMNAHKGTCFRQHVESRPIIQSMGGVCGFLRRQPDFILATAVLLAWDPVKGSFLLHWGLAFFPLRVFSRNGQNLHGFLHGSEAFISFRVAGL